MTVSEKRKNKKTETSGSRKKTEKPGKSHKKIVKILQKKKREKAKKEAGITPESVGDVAISPTESALKLTGLPYSATEEEVRDWFENDDIEVESVHLCGKNRKTGMGYVTMATKSAMRKGLAKDSQHMGHRYINVKVKRKTEMTEVLQLAEMMDNSVFMRGLPYEVYRLDILRLFKGLNIAPHGIHIKNKGFGIVEFTDSKTAQEALKRDKEYIRERYIKIFPCRMKDLVQMREQIFAEKKKQLDPLQNSKGEKTGITSESLEKEVKAEKEAESEDEVEAEEEGNEKEIKAENIGEGSDKDVEMEVEEDSEKPNDIDEEPEESENEEVPQQNQEESDKKKPKKGKTKTEVEVVRDKFSPRRLRSRTGTPIKTPVKRLEKGSARKSKI